MKSYRDILDDLSRAELPFAVIGSRAIEHFYPKWTAIHPPADCDIVMPFEAALLTRACDIVSKQGWLVELWGEPVQLPLSAEQLAGKYYLRARRGGAVLDINFETPLRWETWQSGLWWKDGVPYAARGHLVAAKRFSDRDKDQAFIHWLRQSAWEKR
jgi:hypothetical protein